MSRAALGFMHLALRPLLDENIESHIISAESKSKHFLDLEISLFSLKIQKKWEYFRIVLQLCGSSELCPLCLLTPIQAL